MYKLSFVPSKPLFCYLPVYMLDLILIEWVTKMKLGSNSLEDHPQLSHNRWVLVHCGRGSHILEPGASA
jgi:hypothetical protein